MSANGENTSDHGENNGVSHPDVEHGAPLSKEEAIKIAKERGWGDQMPDSLATSNTAFSGEWFSNPVTYEYNGEEGDIGPAIEQLEQILYNCDLRNTQGGDLSVYDVEVDSEGPAPPPTVMKVRNLTQSTHCL